MLVEILKQNFVFGFVYIVLVTFIIIKLIWHTLDRLFNLLESFEKVKLPNGFEIFLKKFGSLSATTENSNMKKAKAIEVKDE